MRPKHQPAKMPQTIATPLAVLFSAIAMPLLAQAAQPAPAQLAPVRSAPVWSAPVWSAPVWSAPVQLAQSATPPPGLSTSTPTPPIQLPLSPMAVPPSEAARNESRVLGQQLGYINQSNALLATIRVQMIQQLARANSKTPQDTATIVDEVIMPDFKAQLPKLTDSIIDVWASQFTVDDMKTIEAFYKTPVGTKLLRSLPVLNQESMAAGKSWAEPLFQQVVKAHASDLQKRGLKL